ncbi:MAG: hypothetical protein J5965_20395 [Aeriscardovia sp.]|nr:hypothetical protein [Aeriscardovia sp.]
MRKELKIVKERTPLTERFLKSMEDYHITPYRMKIDGVINTSQLITKIKKGLQQPSSQTLKNYCSTYGINMSWIISGEGQMKTKVGATDDKTVAAVGGVLAYRDDFDRVVRAKETGEVLEPDYTISLPYFNDADFWCFAGTTELAPTIWLGDCLAMKRLSTWREYLPKDTICGVVMKEHTMIRRLRSVEGDKEHVLLLPVGDMNATDGETVAKDLIVDLYQVVGSIRNYKSMIR